MRQRGQAGGQAGSQARPQSGNGYGLGLVRVRVQSEGFGFWFRLSFVELCYIEIFQTNKIIKKWKLKKPCSERKKIKEGTRNKSRLGREATNYDSTTGSRIVSIILLFILFFFPCSSNGVKITIINQPHGIINFHVKIDAE